MSGSLFVKIEPDPNKSRNDRVTIKKLSDVRAWDYDLVLEAETWDALEEICWREGKSIHDVCEEVYIKKAEQSSFEAALRHFILNYFRCAATEEGHRNAGHGPSTCISSLSHSRHSGPAFHIKPQTMNNA